MKTSFKNLCLFLYTKNELSPRSPKNFGNVQKWYVLLGIFACLLHHTFSFNTKILQRWTLLWTRASSLKLCWERKKSVFVWRQEQLSLVYKQKRRNFFGQMRGSPLFRQTIIIYTPIYWTVLQQAFESLHLSYQPNILVHFLSYENWSICRTTLYSKRHAC